MTTLSALTKKRKQRGKGKPFEKNNPWRFPIGVSGNPGGRPRKLGESIASGLAREVDGVTVAEILGDLIIEDAVNGSDFNRNLIRLITEGETIHTPDAGKIFVSIDR